MKLLYFRHKVSGINCCFQHAWVQRSLVLGANLNVIQNCTRFLLKITLKFEYFKLQFLNFVTKVYVRLSFNDSYRYLNFFFAFGLLRFIEIIETMSFFIRLV